MPRPIRPWFRVYVEVCRDPKIRRLTPEQRWIWIGILAAARESCEPGALFVAPGLPMSARELADFCGVRERDVTRALPAMEGMSMIANEASGLVRVLNWDHRQFESDDVTKRTRDHRERSGEQGRNVPGNAPETETETETEERHTSAHADPDFDRFWEAYPRKVAKGAARRAWKTARKKAEAKELVSAAATYGVATATTEPRFVQHPASWLNAERWADEPDRPLAVVTDPSQLPPVEESWMRRRPK